MGIDALRDMYTKMQQERLLREGQHPTATPEQLKCEEVVREGFLPTATPESKAAMRHMLHLKPKPPPKKRPHTVEEAPTIKRSDSPPMESEGRKRSPSPRWHRDPTMRFCGRNRRRRFRDYEQELKEFNGEIENMVGGYGSYEFSAREAEVHGRSRSEQEEVEANRRLDIHYAKEKWRKDMNRMWENGESFTVDPKNEPFYWSQYLDFATCLWGLSPPPQRRR